jgi:hypothetical protein
VPVAEGAAHDERTNTPYLNTNYLKPGSDVIQSIVHETQYKLYGDANKNKPPRNRAKEEKIASIRGKIGAGTWDIVGGGNKNPIKNYSTHTRTAWQKKNQELLNKGNLLAESSNYRDLKPRIIEKGDPRYLLAKLRGDKQKAESIKKGWEAIEPDFPVVGPVLEAYDKLVEGDYEGAIVNTIIAGYEAYTLGISSIVKGAGLSLAKGVGKKGVVNAVKRLQGVKVGVAKAVKNVIPKGKLANHLFKGANKLADTPANRVLIQEISNGKALVVDKFGKSWYRGVDASGRGIYSYTQNGVVKGACYTDLSAAEMIAKYGLK